MIQEVKRDTIWSVQRSVQYLELARLGGTREEEVDTLWSRVIRICDQYGLGAREHCLRESGWAHCAPQVF